MNQSIQHCPTCGALQANQPVCGVCGARLTGFEEPGGREAAIGRGAATGIALFVLLLLGGLVAATAIVLLLVFALG